jgi:hypothetical protein
MRDESKPFDQAVSNGNIRQRLSARMPARRLIRDLF